MSYDRALTVFSPDGHLFQVEYANEAVNKSSTSIIVKCNNSFVIGIEIPNKIDLKIENNIKNNKLCYIDEYTFCSCSGIIADARMFISYIQKEVQRYKKDYSLNNVPIEYIAKYASQLQIYSMQKGNMRPFAISLILFNFENNNPRIFNINSSGIYYEYKALAIGKSNDKIMKFLEKEYKDNLNTDQGIELVKESFTKHSDSEIKNIKIYSILNDKSNQLNSFILNLVNN